MGRCLWPVSVSPTSTQGDGGHMQPPCRPQQSGHLLGHNSVHQIRAEGQAHGPFSSGGRHQPHRRHLCLRTFSPLQGPWATHAGCNLLQVPASEMNRTSCSSPHTVADPAGFATSPVAAPQTRILQLPCPRFTARFTKPSTHTFYHELSSRAKGIFNKRYLKTSFE